MEGYLYIIQIREFVKTNEPVYKVGRTCDIIRRYSQYPKSSRLLYLIPCNNLVKKERILLDSLRNKFKNRVDIGLEYFEGVLYDIISTMFSIVFENQTEIKKGINVINLIKEKSTRSTQTESSNPFDLYRYKGIK